MTAEEIIAAIAPAVPGATYEALVSADAAVTPTILVSREHLVATCGALQMPGLEFVAFSDVTAVDFHPNRNPRFDLVYHLVSPHRRARVRLKVRINAQEADRNAVDAVSRRRLARARAVRSVRHRVRRSRRPAPADDAGGLGRPSAAQGLPGAAPQGRADLHAAAGDRRRVQGEHGARSVSAGIGETAIDMSGDLGVEARAKAANVRRSSFAH